MNRRIVSSELFEEEVKALLKEGGYRSKEDALLHALEVLLSANPHLRVGVAVRLFERGKVTLERASEIGGIGMEEFKEELSKRGIKRIVDAGNGELETGVESVKKLRAHK